MAIRYQREHDRAVDEETGEYITSETWHYQSPTRDYSIYTAEGIKICAATVQQEVSDLSGDGLVALFAIKVVGLRQSSGENIWSLVTDQSSPIAQKFVRFLTPYLVDHPAVQFFTNIAFALGEPQ